MQLERQPLVMLHGLTALREDHEGTKSTKKEGLGLESVDNQIALEQSR